MASDFWAGYLSGAIGIVIGNPLDVIKVRLQAGHNSAGAAAAAASQQRLSRFELVRGLISTPAYMLKLMIDFFYNRSYSSYPWIWGPQRYSFRRL